jgi:hypothetical protein
MTGLGIAVAFLLLLWCALLYVPFRWRPVGIYLIVEKWLAVGYVPFIAAIGTALAIVGAVFGSWWIAAPAAAAAAGAILVIVRVGAVPVDLAGALGASWDERIPPERHSRLVHRWWTGPLRRTDAELTVVRAARHAHDVVTPAADRPIARLLQLATSMSIPVGPSTDRCSRARSGRTLRRAGRALAASHQPGGSAWALTRKIG